MNNNIVIYLCLQVLFDIKDNNKLTSLPDLNDNLQELSCHNNQLT